MKARAFIFDLDGTLIDSMPLHRRAWRQCIESLGLVNAITPDFFERTAGRSNAEIFQMLAPHQSQAEHEAHAFLKETIYRELAARELRAVQGAMSFLNAALAAGVPLAIATAAPQGNIDVAIQRFELHRFTDVITCPEQGLRGKPHPDLFAQAAARLRITPGDCLVFEDAPLGVEAARNAGMKAVALTTTLPQPTFSGFDNLLFTAPHFDDLEVQRLIPTTTRSHN